VEECNYDISLEKIVVWKEKRPMEKVDVVGSFLKGKTERKYGCCVNV
jgi:hypothetical protein